MRDLNWNSFNFTLDVIIASARAKEDLQISERFRSALEFRLLAASDEEDARLPLRGWADIRQILAVEIEETPQEFRANFQSLGYAALHQVAGRSARMLSDNNTIDVAFRFDSQGRGIAIVANTPLTRSALTHFRVLLE